jgi:hypothetical protein
MRYRSLADRDTGHALLLEARGQLVRCGALAEVAAIDRSLTE